MIIKNLNSRLRLYAVVSASLATPQLNAQTENIQIGQPVPDIQITNIHNYKTTTVRFSDFKGKLLILDFWATWCSPCVAMMPRMDSLQKQFEGKIQFLSITYQTQKEVISFIEKLKKSRPAFDHKSVIPLVTTDKKLHQLFPHKFLPHYVWIGTDGLLKAITGYEEINTVTLKAMLENAMVLPKMKNDKLVQHNSSFPLFSAQNNFTNDYISKRSTFSGYIDGLGSGFYQNITSKDSSSFKRITVRNRVIPLIYSVAFSDGRRLFSWNKILLEVKDPSKLNTKKTGQEFREWLSQGNGFCYELILPSSQAANAWKFMQDDLAAYFPQYKATVEKRMMPCLGLQRIPGTDSLTASGDTTYSLFDRFGLSLRNYPLSRLVMELNVKWLQHSTMPIVDLTGYKTRVDIDVQADLSDLVSLNKALHKYGLVLSETTQIQEMLIIRDTDSHSLTTSNK